MHCDERERMRFTVEPDFVRVYYDPPGTDDLHLISVKNVRFTVLRSRRNASSGLAADLDVSVSDNLDALMGLEDVLREDVQAFISSDNDGRFPSGGIENRMLLHRVQAPHQIVTRLRFLGGRFGELVADLAAGESAVANIALMGLKISRGEIFPVWRVTRMAAIENQAPITSVAQPPQPDSEPDDEEEPEPTDKGPTNNEDHHEDHHEDGNEDCEHDDGNEDGNEDCEHEDGNEDCEHELGEVIEEEEPSREVMLRRLRDELVSDIDAKFDGLFHASSASRRNAPAE